MNKSWAQRAENKQCKLSGRQSKCREKRGEKKKAGGTEKKRKNRPKGHRLKLTSERRAEGKGHMKIWRHEKSGLRVPIVRVL